MVNARWMKILEEECSRWSYILSWKSIEGRFYIRFTLQGTSSHSVHQPNIPFLGTPLISALFMWSIEEYEICLMLNLVEYSYTLWNFLLRWAHATCPPAFDDGYNDIHSLGWNDFQEPADFAAPPGEPDGLDRPIRVAEYDGGSDKLRRRCFSSSLPHCWTGGGEIKETAPPPPQNFWDCWRRSLTWSEERVCQVKPSPPCLTYHIWMHAFVYAIYVHVCVHLCMYECRWVRQGLVVVGGSRVDWLFIFHVLIMFIILGFWILGSLWSLPACRLLFCCFCCLLLLLLLLIMMVVIEREREREYLVSGFQFVQLGEETGFHYHLILR